jgi:hypothetical protein
MKKQKKRLEGRDSKAGATLLIETSAGDTAGSHALLREALGIGAAAREALGIAEAAREASGSSVPAREALGIGAPVRDALRMTVPARKASGIAAPAREVSAIAVPASEASVIAVPAGEAPALVAEVTSLSAFALHCQQMYQAARIKRADGCIQLDAERLAHALADTGIGSRAEQALYSLAILAAADGDLTLFQDDVIAALRKAS